MKDTAEQGKNKGIDKRIANLLPHQFKKGQSGNPSGRPKGSVSMKEYVKNMLASMNEDERQTFLEGIPKVDIWKLGEGNPESTTDITSKGEKLTINDDQFNRIIRTRAEKLSGEESSTGGVN